MVLVNIINIGLYTDQCQQSLTANYRLFKKRLIFRDRPGDVDFSGKGWRVAANLQDDHGHVFLGFVAVHRDSPLQEKFSDLIGGKLVAFFDRAENEVFNFVFFHRVFSGIERAFGKHEDRVPRFHGNFCDGRMQGFDSTQTVRGGAPGIHDSVLIEINRNIRAAADNDGPGLEIGGYHTEVSADMTGMLPKDLVGNALDGSAVAEIFRDLFKNTVDDDGGNDLAWLSVAFSVAIDNRLTAGRPFDELSGFITVGTAYPFLFRDAKFNDHGGDYIKFNRCFGGAEIVRITPARYSICIKCEIL